MAGWLACGLLTQSPLIHNEKSFSFTLSRICPRAQCGIYCSGGTFDTPTKWDTIIFLLKLFLFVCSDIVEKLKVDVDDEEKGEKECYNVSQREDTCNNMYTLQLATVLLVCSLSSNFCVYLTVDIS